MYEHVKLHPGVGTFILVYNDPLRSTQPGHPSMGKSSEYRPVGVMLWLGSKSRYGSQLVAGKTCRTFVILLNSHLHHPPCFSYQKLGSFCMQLVHKFLV